MKVKITDKNDFSGNKRYEARVGDKIVMYETDGFWHPHLTKKEFIKAVKHELK